MWRESREVPSEFKVLLGVKVLVSCVGHEL